METEVIVKSEEDVKNQELVKELDELSDYPQSSVEEKPKEPTETDKPADSKPADTGSVKADEVKPEVKVEPEIDYKAEAEKWRDLTLKKEKALQDLRLKRKQDLERLENLVVSQPAKTAGEKEEIQPEVREIIKQVIEPELESIKQEMQMGKREKAYEAEESRLIERHGKDKHAIAVRNFQTLINPESDGYDPEIVRSWKENTLNPAEFAFGIGMSMGLEGYIDSVRAEVAEKTKKDTLEGLKNSALRTIPSLSGIGGGAPENRKPDSLRKEMDEL